MPSRRGAITMTPEEQERYLHDGWTLQVASIGPKGYPHLVAMWYAVIDGAIHFTTFRKSQKVLNLRRNPKLTCMLESGKAYSELRGLVIEGEGEIIDDVEMTQQVMREVGRRNPAGADAVAVTPEQAAAQRALAGKRIVVRVHPENVISWDHTKLGGRY
jgi:nitroimidazol reductase NimA-like FMN-containing flavoprotein (pyridoxamine 5'-phosphate oxidase superfamily)